MQAAVAPELGWTVVSDRQVYAPGDDERLHMYSVAAAATTAGLPATLDELESWRREPADHDSPRRPVGEPWRTPVTAEARGGVRAIEFDAAIAERGLQGHVQIETELPSALEALGIAALSPKPENPPFDIAWVHGERFFVAEVKSVTADNEEHQLRLGLGQVLRYRWALEARVGRGVKALLVPELEPTDVVWPELCASVGVVLLPATKIAGELGNLIRAQADAFRAHQYQIVDRGFFATANSLLDRKRKALDSRACLTVPRASSPSLPCPLTGRPSDTCGTVVTDAADHALELATTPTARSSSADRYPAKRPSSVCRRIPRQSR